MTNGTSCYANNRSRLTSVTVKVNGKAGFAFSRDEPWPSFGCPTEKCLFYAGLRRTPPLVSLRSRPAMGLLIERAVQVKLGEIQAQVELQLVIVGFHVFTQLIKGFIVVALFKVCQFMHHNHAQKFLRHLFKQ